MKFSYKLALTIALSVIITYIVLDVSLIILYQLVVSKQLVSDSYNINEFNQFSSDQIASTTKNFVSTGLDLYQQVVYEIYQSYNKFHDNPELYTSKLERGTNPELTQNFQTPNYDRSAAYFFTPTSTFYNQPYLDSALACAISSNRPQLTKRVNVIYQNIQDPTNIMARTTPGTSDFVIKQASQITARFNQLSPGQFKLVAPYTDQFSKTNNTTQLFAIRYRFPEISTQYRMYAEIQANLFIANASLRQIYAYPTTALALLYITDLQDNQYDLFGASPTFDNYKSIQFKNYLKQGVYNVSNDDGQFLVTTKNLSNGVKDTQVQNLRLLLILNKTQTNSANLAYQQFIVSEKSTLIQFLIVWSLIMVIIMIGIGYALADYLFSYFSIIKNKCQQYIKDPQQAQKLYFQMKEIASQQNHNRIVIQNMISIIQKIQAKKKMNQCADVGKKFKKKKKNQSQQSDANSRKKKEVKTAPFDQYPLNMLSKSFQQRNKMRDWQRFQELRIQLVEKLEAAKAASGKKD